MVSHQKLPGHEMHAPQLAVLPPLPIWRGQVRRRVSNTSNIDQIIVEHKKQKINCSTIVQQKIKFIVSTIVQQKKHQQCLAMVDPLWFFFFQSAKLWVF